MVEILAGQKIEVADDRARAIRKGPPGGILVAEGTIQSMGDQEGVQYLYLDTGYYIVIHPRLVAEATTSESEKVADILKGLKNVLKRLKRHDRLSVRPYEVASIEKIVVDFEKEIKALSELKLHYDDVKQYMDLIMNQTIKVAKAVFG